jgi:ribosome assembly protein 4
MSKINKRAKLETPNVSVSCQFRNTDGEDTGPLVNLPVNSTPEQLSLLVNHLLEDDNIYSFMVNDTEIIKELYQDIIYAKNHSTEETIIITYEPQAVFKVRTVSRCTSSLSGHSESILSVCFSPDGRSLASGSGDNTVRIWDLNTETPRFTLKGHTNWVQHVAWSPDCKLLASGSMDKTVN